jgi:hypothetical protein
LGSLVDVRASFCFLPFWLTEKPRVDALLDCKAVLLHWAWDYIENFYAIYPLWDREIKNHIVGIGNHLKLETKHYVKNNLADSNISLFFRQLWKYRHGLDNWKQRYLAWNLTYMTGVRPSSITVAPGYEKDSQTGCLARKSRGKNHTNE